MGAIAAQVHRHVVGEHPPLAADARAPTPADGAPAVGPQRIALDARGNSDWIASTGVLSTLLPSWAMPAMPSRVGRAP